MADAMVAAGRFAEIWQLNIDLNKADADNFERIAAAQTKKGKISDVIARLDAIEQTHVRCDILAAIVKIQNE